MGALTDDVQFTERIDFPSQAENIHLVEKLIDEVCARSNVHESHYGNILIALTEAVNNAIHHGNRQDPERRVVVGYEVKDDAIIFMVGDEGPGFDHDHLPDPTDPENIEKPHGRGVFLMRALADKVEFTDNGATVVMSFGLAPGERVSPAKAPRSSPIHFLVRSGTTNAFRDRTALRQWLLRVAEAEGRRVGSITYVLMSDNELLAYNRQYLAHDDLTDVITFHEGQDEDLEGDILISYERVKENAREYHVHHTAELHRVMVHGLLHLCGHQDKTAPQRTAMRQLEDRYLSWR